MARATKRSRRDRREVAEQMNAEWRQLTPQQQLNALDYRLGKGEGAKKQRARLLAKIEQEKEAAATAENAKARKKKKKTKAA